MVSVLSFYYDDLVRIYSFNLVKLFEKKEKVAGNKIEKHEHKTAVCLFL